ncbi:MAG TPA: hypothetical protein VE944_26705 [Nostoc sp.]|uniref:hypothetical protein n=1 Tax=Nostoc sp. TaxID=1180 RepID=UPI002D5F77CC|nr:hypothetical protein [Nostoc sp.]HYX17886.1 hypothetical protein [Nostoc sp.]
MQQPPEELIEQARQAIEGDRPENRPETRLDYQTIRDGILRSLRGKVATSSPQYRSVTKALDRFIAEIQAGANPPQKNE